MGARKSVSIAVQVILCLIPIVWLYRFYRIEKLGARLLMVIAVAIFALLLQFFIPFYLGYTLAWLVSFLFPIYYMIKWFQEWNEEILIGTEEGKNEDDTETRYRLD